MKTDEFLNEMKNIINEDNISELKKELDYLYKGIGWAEWDYFKEGLAYSTNFKPEETTDEDLEKMINSSGIAKVKKVEEIKDYSDMEDFDPKDFNPDDKIILTKKPMSDQFYSESSQKNEALNGLNDYKRFYEDMKEFREDMAKVFPGDKRELLDQIDHLLYVIRAMWDGEIIDESSQRNESLDLSKLSSKDAEKLSKYFNDFAKDKTVRYDLIDKIEDILKNKYKIAK